MVYIKEVCKPSLLNPRPRIGSLGSMGCLYLTDSTIEISVYGQDQFVIAILVGIYDRYDYMCNFCQSVSA